MNSGQEAGSPSPSKLGVNSVGINSEQGETKFLNLFLPRMDTDRGTQWIDRYKIVPYSVFKEPFPLKMQRRCSGLAANSAEGSE